MNAEQEFITLIAFPELRDALPYAQALSEEGIEHRISEKFLDFDPFFTGQRKMDQVKIEVATTAHEAALAAIEKVDTGTLSVVKGTTGPNKHSGSKAPWVVASVVLLLSTLYFAQRTSQQQDTPPLTDPLKHYNALDGSTIGIWQHNDEQAFEEFDEDQNGIPEKGELYNREGDLRHIWFDRDQNGMVDEWQHFNEVGRRTTSYFDRNADGLFEELTEHRSNGDIVFIDSNGNGFFEAEERLEN